MLYIRKLTEEEEHELSQRLKAAAKTKVFLRLKTVELSHQGHSVQEISALLGRHPNSIRSYLSLFNQGGFAALMPKWGGGAKRKLEGLDKDFWEDLLSRPPCSFEKLHTLSQRWTYDLLKQYVQEYEGRTVSPVAIWGHLRRVKYTSGRSKLSVTSPDPDYQVKRERVETLEKKVFQAP